MRRLFLLLIVSAVLLIPTAARAGYRRAHYSRRNHRSYVVPAERPYLWRTWGAYPVGVTQVEYTNWGYGTYDSDAPKLYFDHYGRPLAGECVLNGGWTECGLYDYPTGSTTLQINIINTK